MAEAVYKEDVTDRDYSVLSIGMIRSDVNVTRRDVDALKGGMAEIKRDIRVLKSDMRESKADITYIKQDVSGLKADVATLKRGELAWQRIIHNIRTGSSVSFLVQRRIRRGH